VVPPPTLNTGGAWSSSGTDTVIGAGAGGIGVGVTPSRGFANEQCRAVPQTRLTNEQPSTDDVERVRERLRDVGWDAKAESAARS